MSVVCLYCNKAIHGIASQILYHCHRCNVSFTLKTPISYSSGEMIVSLIRFDIPTALKKSYSFGNNTWTASENIIVRFYFKVIENQDFFLTLNGPDIDIKLEGNDAFDFITQNIQSMEERFSRLSSFI